MFTERERALLLSSSWPLHLLEDPRRQPHEVDSLDAFVKEVLLGDHLEDVVVLHNGISASGLHEKEALPQWLSTALDRSSTVLECLQSLGEDALQTHKAALEFVDDLGAQREVLPRPYPFCLWDAPATGSDAMGTREQLYGASAMPEAWRNLQQRLAATMARIERGEVDATRLYACEMRRLRERDANPGALACSSDEKTKSLSLRHARDRLGESARWSLYWNCYDDGLFIGGSGSGKGLHVDQVLWSNVGKHWRGYKLLAIWPAGDVSARMVAELGDAHFRPPLAAKHHAALEKAAKLVLLRPGDLFLVSGGVAHTTLCISEELAVTGYESLVTLHPRHVEHFLRTVPAGAGCGEALLCGGTMECEDFRELLQGPVRRRVLALLADEISVVERSTAGFHRWKSLGEDAVRSELRGMLVSAAQALAGSAAISSGLGGAPEVRDFRAQLLAGAEALRHRCLPEGPERKRQRRSSEDRQSSAGGAFLQRAAILSAALAELGSEATDGTWKLQPDLKAAEGGPDLCIGSPASQAIPSSPSSSSSSSASSDSSPPHIDAADIRDAGTELSKDLVDMVALHTSVE